MTAVAPLTFAVDTGGTFTDLVLDDGASLHLFKAPTTPHDPVEGVLDVLGAAAGALGVPLGDLLARGDRLIHGTTHAINALVTGTTARTAFLTTAGHPDILLIREGGRTDPFNFAVPYPEPLVPRALTFEVPERIAADGSVVVALDEAALAGVLDRVAAANVEAVGVALLWSIINPEHEERVGVLLEERLPGVPYTLSHRLNPTLREYRRASSSCIDASLKPLMSTYVGSLERRLAAEGFAGRVMMVTSQGGMLDAADVAGTPIHLINSGPAMAPVAGRFYAERDTGADGVIIADTGGTTFDVTLVREGRIPRTRETWIGPVHQGHITGFPSVDVTSVGSGGGSIAWVDEGGLLRVGPRSAGSRPGPACYALGGTDATLTDACAVLGYVDPERFLGGAMPLDVDAARDAIERSVAGPLGLEVDAAAAAILRVTTEDMVHAIEEITVNQGIDPRRTVLVGGGGAAGLNLVAIARRLGCAEVLIPETGAALSAAGALISDISYERARTHVTRSDAFDFAGVGAVLAELTAGCEAFAERAAPGAAHAISYVVEARYPRQNWEIEVEIDGPQLAGDEDVAALERRFHETHERLFAIAEPESPVEIVTWRAQLRATSRDVGSHRISDPDPGGRPARRRRRAFFQDAGWVEATVADLDGLADGDRLDGPAIIESSFTTIVVDGNAHATRADGGTVVIDVRGPA